MIYLYKGEITVEETAVEWLRENRVFWKQSTYSKYYHIVYDIVKETLPDVTILQLSEKAVQSEVNRMLAQNRSVSYARDYVTVLNAVLQFAAEEGFACATKLHILFPKKKKAQMPYLSRAEQRLLVRYLLKSPDLIKIGILFALYTGVRCGELCALQWSDIDLTENTVMISKTLQRIQNRNEADKPKTQVVIMTPKSEDSCRIIPIPDFLARILKEYQPSRNSAYLLTGMPDKRIEPRCLQYKFKRFIRDCGLNDINFHALRHTFATRCIELGFDMKTLSEILGHADVKTTMSLYVHSSLELKANNMKKLNSIAI